MIVQEMNEKIMCDYCLIEMDAFEKDSLRCMNCSTVIKKDYY